jgi:uncharacterized protein YjbJ (UPF0337 family)
MKADQAADQLDELSGQIKQGTARVPDHLGLQAECVIDEASGELKQAYGNLKGAVKSTDKSIRSDFNDG